MRISERTWSESLAVSTISDHCSLLGPGLRCLGRLCIYSAFGRFSVAFSFREWLFLLLVLLQSSCLFWSNFLYVRSSVNLSCTYVPTALQYYRNVVVIVIVAFQQCAGRRSPTVPHTRISAMLKKKTCDIECLASQCQK